MPGSRTASAVRRRWAARLAAAFVFDARLEAKPAAPATASKPGRGASATGRCADGARGGRRHRAAGAPPARPGRDLAAAGPARRRRRRACPAMPREIERDGMRLGCGPGSHVPAEAIEAYVRRHRLRPRRRRQQRRPALRAQPAAAAGLAGADRAAFPHAEQTTLADTARRGPRRRLPRRTGGARSVARRRRARPCLCGVARAVGAARRANVLRALAARPNVRGAGAALWSAPARRSWAARGARAGRWERRTRAVAAASWPRRCWSCRADEPDGVVIARRARRAGRPGLAAWRAGTGRVVSPGGRGRRAARPGWAVELRARSGGEHFQAGIGRPPRSLKKQYQAQGVPAWERDGPLLYSGGQLVYVPGLGLDARVIGLPGQPLVSLRWEPSAAG